MSPANATPGTEMIVSVDVSALTIESPIAHHGIVLPARKYPRSDRSFDPRNLSPNSVIPTR